MEGGKLLNLEEYTIRIKTQKSNKNKNLNTRKSDQQ